MKIILLNVISFLLFICSNAYGQEVVNTTLVHDGKERNFDVYIPAAYSPSGEAVPVIFNFHGFGSNAFEQRLYSGMDMIADTANFLVCYPDGIDNAWNVGWTFGSSEDDVGFVEKMIEHLSDSYNIDPKRVYSCGMSNGGFFSYKLACELSNKIAAVASVTGSIVPGQEAVCMPELQTPILEIHGTADDVVNYNGSSGISMPILDVIDHWLEINNCDATVVNETSYPNLSSSDGSTADRIEYDFCDEDLEVVLIRINGGGHTWPGSVINIGSTNQDFNASSEIWNFFRKFQRSIGTNVEETDLLNELVILSPNPSRGQIKISSPKYSIESIKIFDSNLKLIRSNKLIQSNELIFNHFLKGSYYAQITIDGQTIFKAFIVL